MTAIEIIILLVAGLALALHFLPKQANPLIAKAQSDVDGVWDFLLNHFSKTAVTATPVVPVSVAPVPVSVTAPITPAQYVAACLAASAGTGGYRNGASWNQIAFLKALSAKDFATWCAGLAAQPECAQKLDAGVVPSVLNSASAGWLVGLSQQGQGIVFTLDGQGLPIPAVDPRV
jgi:hypothetical protein